MNFRHSHISHLLVVSITAITAVVASAALTTAQAQAPGPQTPVAISAVQAGRSATLDLHLAGIKPANVIINLTAVGEGAPPTNIIVAPKRADSRWIWVAPSTAHST